MVMANTAAVTTPVNTTLTAAMLGLNLAPSTVPLGSTAAAASYNLHGMQLSDAWPAGGATAADGGGQLTGSMSRTGRTV